MSNNATNTTSTSSSSDDVYKRFNKNTKMFLKELMRSFPHIKEFHFVYAAYKLVKTFGKKIVQRYSNESFGEPFAEHIRTCNEAFFMSEAFQLPPEYRFYSEYIPSFQKLWASLDTSNKDAIWQHLNALLILNQDCINYQRSKKATDGIADLEEDYKTCCQELHVGIKAA